MRIGIKERIKRWRRKMSVHEQDYERRKGKKRLREGSLRKRQQKMASKKKRKGVGRGIIKVKGNNEK